MCRYNQRKRKESISGIAQGKGVSCLVSFCLELLSAASLCVAHEIRGLHTEGFCRCRLVFVQSNSWICFNKVEVNLVTE